MKPSTPGAIARVEEALRCVLRAQAELNSAHQMLSKVRRGASTYTATARAVQRTYELADKIRRLLLRTNLSLDTEQP